MRRGMKGYLARLGRWGIAGVAILLGIVSLANACALALASPAAVPPAAPASMLILFVTFLVIIVEVLVGFGLACLLQGAVLILGPRPLLTRLRAWFFDHAAWWMMAMPLGACFLSTLIALVGLIAGP